MKKKDDITPRYKTDIINVCYIYHSTSLSYLLLTQFVITQDDSF